MALGYLHHSASLNHQNPAGHPENAQRLSVIEQAVRLTEENGLSLHRQALQPCPRETLYLAHPQHYIDTLFEQQPTQGLVYIDADTSLSAGTMDAVLHACGGLIQAANTLCSTQNDAPYSRAFCAVRPPGHHAEIATAMGFCVVNHIAVVARYITQQLHLKVAIVDFDVHHGNGTEAILTGDDNVLFCSTYQQHIFPMGTQQGTHDNVVNVGFAAGTRGAEYRRTFEQIITPAINAFQPDILLISAGFDGHEQDPLAQLCLNDEDYYWLGETLKTYAHQHCNNRAIATLEGGYNLSVVGGSVSAFLHGFSDQSSS